MPDIRLMLRRSSVTLLFTGTACATAPRAITSVTGPIPFSPLTPRQAEFLDTLERRTFNWFWERTDPSNGLTPDRWPTKSFSSVAAIGFALTAYPVGVERGYVTRDAAGVRALNTLRFLYQAPQSDQPTNVTGYKGFFYHFLDMQTGHRFEKVELSTIDSSLLLAGVLFCQSYFTGSDATESAIRAYADSLYLRVDWQWFRPHAPLVNMGWRPEKGFIESDWHGLNEGMIIYILALGSPTHPIRSTRRPGRSGRVPTAGPSSTDSSSSTSGRCSDTNTRRSGSTIVAFRTRSCAGRGSITSRTQEDRRIHSARTRSPIQISRRTMARTSGD